MKYLARGRLTFVLVSISLVLFVASFAIVSLGLNAVRAAPSTAPKIQRGHIPADASTNDWAEFHGDAARDGNLGSDTTLSNSNITSLASLTGTAYTNTTGSSESSPVIYQGILYYAGNTIQTVGTKSLHISTIYAVDLTQNAVVWQVQTPSCGGTTKYGWINSTPALTTGMVNGVATPELFVGRMSNKQGCIDDFNAQTGALIWSFFTVLEVQSSPAIMSTDNGNIVVVGDNNGYLHAFSVDYNGTLGGKGNQLWVYDTRTDIPPAGYAQYCLPAPELCGDAIWSSPAEGLVSVGGIDQHYAYFGIGAQANTVGRIDAIDLDTLVNNVPVMAWSFWDQHPQYDDDFGTISVLTDMNGYALRVYSGENDGDVYGVDALTGAMYFDFNPASQLGGHATSKTHSTGALVTINGVTEYIFGSGCESKPNCGGLFGYMWAIDALSTDPNGTFLWKSQNFGGDIVSSPVVVNQDPNAVVLVMGPWKTKTGTLGDLLALDPSSGALLASYPVYNQAYGSISTPAVYGGTVFVTVGFTAYNNPKAGFGGVAAFQCTAC